MSERGKLRRAAGFALMGLALAAAVCGLFVQTRPRVDVYAAKVMQRTMPVVDWPNGTVDVNTDDLYELLELPGVGETLAQAILDEHALHGPFHYPEDLLAVKGIGPAKLRQIRDWLDFSAEE